MATITTSFLKQGTCGSAGNIRTCLRYGNAGVSSTCDIGGPGSGTNYQNVVPVRFDSLPNAVSSATLTITYQQSGSDYWAAAQTLGVKACSNFTNSTTGVALPTVYGTAKTANLAGSTASITIDVTAQMKLSLANGSKCLYIYADAANNRKRVAAIDLTYEPIKVQLDGVAASSVTVNGQAVTSLKFNNTTIF